MFEFLDDGVKQGGNQKCVGDGLIDQGIDDPGRRRVCGVHRGHPDVHPVVRPGGPGGVEVGWDDQSPAVGSEAVDIRVRDGRLDRPTGQRDRLRVAGGSRGEVDEGFIVIMWHNRFRWFSGRRPLVVGGLDHGQAGGMQVRGHVHKPGVDDPVIQADRLGDRGQISRWQPEVQSHDRRAASPRTQHADGVTDRVGSQPGHPVAWAHCVPGE